MQGRVLIGRLCRYVRGSGPEGGLATRAVPWNFLSEYVSEWRGQLRLGETVDRTLHSIGSETP